MKLFMQIWPTLNFHVCIRQRSKSVNGEIHLSGCRSIEGNDITIIIIIIIIIIITILLCS